MEATIHSIPHGSDHYLSISIGNDHQRSLILSLLQLSILIDEEDAVQPRSIKRFCGWEKVCEVFVSRDESLISSSDLSRYSEKQYARKKGEGNVVHSLFSDDSNDDNDDNDERAYPITPPPIELIEKRTEGRRINKRFVSARMPILSPSLSPTSPPASISPTSFTLPPIGPANNLEKKDFLPKIEPRHSPSRKEREIAESRNASQYSGQFSKDIPPHNLHLYTPESIYEPLTPSSSYRPHESSKKTIELPDAPAHLRMYYPRSARMYNSNSASKKPVNIS